MMEFHISVIVMDGMPYVNVLELEAGLRDAANYYGEQLRTEAAHTCSGFADALVPLYGPIPEDA